MLRRRQGMPGGRSASSLLELLEPLGELIPLDEDLMDPAMAVMSSSPAYIALVAEALARGGEREGLDPKLAGELVARSPGRHRGAPAEARSGDDPRRRCVAGWRHGGRARPSSRESWRMPS